MIKCTPKNQTINQIWNYQQYQKLGSWCLCQLIHFADLNVWEKIEWLKFVCGGAFNAVLGEGFEPSKACADGFTDRSDWPLRHPSLLTIFYAILLNLLVIDHFRLRSRYFVLIISQDFILDTLADRPASQRIYLFTLSIVYACDCEPREGIGPSTSILPRWRSTTELPRHNLAPEYGFYQIILR